MVKRYLSNPIFLSVIFLCIIFYSGLFNIPEPFGYESLIDSSEVNCIQGYIMSSPSKSSSGKYYSAKFKITDIKSDEIKCSAKGIFTVLIPVELVEAYYPGKLYSKLKSHKAFVYETGANYNFTGKFSNGLFIVKNCNNCIFNKSLYGKIDYFRCLCRLQFKRLMFSWKNAGGLLLALLCGAREYTEPEVSESFRNAGLSHILALSGMHLSLFSGIGLFIGNRTGRKKLTFVIRIISLILFLWFAGFSPSLTRAFICSMLMLFAGVAGVDQPDMILILCFTFLLQCILYPGDIFNYGFMLSYSALFGILFTQKLWFRILNKVLPGYLSASLSSSTGAQILTVPVSLKMFRAYSPIGIIATSVISPLVTVFIYTGLVLIVICLLFPGLVTCSGILLNFEYTIIKYLVNVFAKTPRITI